MNSNLFIASTPLQLLNATEARDRFHCTDHNCLAVVRSPLRKRTRARQFTEILHHLIDENWDQVWFPRIGKVEQLAFAVVARKFIESVGQPERIYTGSFQTLQSHLINSIEYNELCLVDDGCSIHTILDKYSNAHRTTKLRDIVSRRCARWPTGKKLHAFSAFNISWPSELVVKNDYRCLRQRLSETIDTHDDEAVLIAQPIENDFGIKVDYVALCEHLKEMLGTKRIRVINHPNDRNPYLGGEFLPYPIELFAMREGYLPKVFITFFSSAIRNLQLIYGGDCICLRLPEAALASQPDYDARDYYDDYENSGIEVQPASQRYLSSSQ